METFSLQSLYGVLDQLRARADQIDQTGQWPQQDLQELAGVGAMRWIIPAEFGGEGVAPLDLHKRYQAIASASLTTALILTQRDSAANIINSATAWPQRAEAMRRLAANEVFTTVGIAQLTTSRQRGAPALAAKRVDGGYELNGEIPWATGASHAEFIIAGAVLQDRNQILFALPMDLPGVRTSPPLPLVALAASHTSNITCDAARLPEGQILHGPVEQALSLRSKGVPIGQAFLALGLCDGAIRLIRAIDSEAAKSAYNKLIDQLAVLSTEVSNYCEPAAAPDPERGNTLRSQCIDLALRTAHAAVSLYKGMGLLEGHPAQRLAREALFLLVWSCPSPVVECTLELLSAPSPTGSQSHRGDRGRG